MFPVSLIIKRYVLLCVAFSSSKNFLRQNIQPDSHLRLFLCTDKTILIVQRLSVSHFALEYVSSFLSVFQCRKTLFFLLWTSTMNSIRLFFVFVFLFVPFCLERACLHNVSHCYFFHFARVISERCVDKDLSLEIKTKDTQPIFSLESCN
jgi:hypothetical protein